MKRYCYSIILFLLPFFIVDQAIAQDQQANRYRADKFFEIKNYTNALKIYEELIGSGEKDPMLMYKTGASLLETKNIQSAISAIPYLEYAFESKDATIPKEVSYYLGMAYHKNEDLHKAIEHLSAYKKALSSSDKGKQADTDKLITQAQNALGQMNLVKTYNIVRLGDNINSEFTEYNPVVMADESMMAYTALKPADGKSKNPEDFIENIYLSYKENGQWSTPKSLNVNTKSNIGTAGLSADGRQMIIFISSGNNTGSLYTIEKSGDKWSSPSPLGNSINSGYLESTASITSDGKAIYFASNRRGGAGGMDIYKVEKLANGSWGPAVSLGASINTSDNEDAPFIHPDGRTLFFTSDGKGTMGGKDIFRTQLVDGKWETPENMGFPVNTVADDSYFTLTADGTKGFFSSDRPGGLGGQDIYAFDMPAKLVNVPLTMIKGRILAGESETPVNTKIKIIDVENGQKIDYVYNPDRETGNYLIIFPPGKNYDMIIEAEGFLPYTININIPEQSYFYELYQKINLSPITQFEKVVGQKVSVSNAFYDTKQDKNDQPRQANESMLLKNDSIDVFNMMEDIIAASDEAALDYLLKLMQMVNPIDEVSFESENAEAVESVYYFEEDDQTKLQAKIVAKDTIFTLPTIYVSEESAVQKAEKSKPATHDKSLVNKIYKFYFDVDKSSLNSKFDQQLEEVLSLLKVHEALAIEISGFASADGDETYNRKISNERAVAVLNFFNERGISRRRIIAKGFGSSTGASSKEEARRVEVKVVDVNVL